jgi:hypothetical protein
MIVPIHCDGWAHFTQNAEDLERSFKALGIACGCGCSNPAYLQ